MRKFLSLALVVVFVLSLATMGFAEVVYTRGVDARVLTSVVTGATASLSTAVTKVNRILGFSFTDSSAGSCGLYDSAAANDTAVTKLIAEATCAAGTIVTQMFPLPRDLTYGLVTKNSASTGVLTVYYE